MKKINPHLALVFILLFIIITAFSTVHNSKKIIVSSVTAANVASNDYNLNISILLDLSDRISLTKSPGAYKNDLGHISSIADAFVTHVRSKKIIMMNDQMQIYFEPTPSDSKINDVAQKLRIQLTKNNSTKQFIESIKPKYNKLSNELYNLALQNKQFIGSDIWGFVTTKSGNYCIKDQSRNILIILTDGYMFHQNKKNIVGHKSTYITPALIKEFGLNKNDYENKFRTGGYGFITKNKGQLAKLNILVVGIAPSKSNPYDEELINLYWSSWFKEMGIKNFKIISSDLPSNLDPVIKDYILNKAG